MDIYLSKTVCSNLELDNKTIGVYVALRSLYDNTDRPIMYVNDTMLCYELLGSTDIPRRFKDSIHKSLTNLVNVGLVSIVEEISKSEYILDLSGLYIDEVNKKTKEKEYYLKITLNEVHKIFSVSSEVDKFALLRYFIQMLGTINFTQGVYIDAIGNEKKNFVGYMTQEYLAKITGITVNSVIAYNNVLEEMKLIYVYKHKNYIYDGTLKSFSNHYGRYADAKYIKQFAEQYEETNGVFSEEIKLIKKKANNGRSLTQKYNALCNGKDYSVAEVEEIYNYIHEKNMILLKGVENEDDKNILIDSLDGYRSEEVFEEYLDENGNFIKDNDPLSIFKVSKGA